MMMNNMNRVFLESEERDRKRESEGEIGNNRTTTWLSC